MLDVGPFETTIGIRFNNINLLKEALTHRSYLNERPNWPVPHNERLEYLGDAVLELAVTEKLFALFPEYPEGQLTVLRAALVNYQILGKIAAEIGMEQYMLMSKGERGDNQRAKEVILANAFEALVGAIYLDHGFATVSKFVEKFLIVHLDEILRTKSLFRSVSERLLPTRSSPNRARPISACSRSASILTIAWWPRAPAAPSRKRSLLRQKKLWRSMEEVSSWPARLNGSNRSVG
jgi:ribonuclease III